MELPPHALSADDGVVVHGVIVVRKRGRVIPVHVHRVVKRIPFPVRHDGHLSDHTQKSDSENKKQFNHIPFFLCLTLTVFRIYHEFNLKRVMK